MINKRYISKLPDPKAVDFIWKDQALTLIRDLSICCLKDKSIRTMKAYVRDILAIAILTRGPGPEFLKMMNLKSLKIEFKDVVYENILKAIR